MLNVNFDKKGAVLPSAAVFTRVSGSLGWVSVGLAYGVIGLVAVVNYISSWCGMYIYYAGWVPALSFSCSHHHVFSLC